MKEIKDGDYIVLCGSKETIVMPGSKPYKCHECGVDVACSDEGQKLINEKNAKPYCPKCGVALFLKSQAEGRDPELIDPKPAIKKAIQFLKSTQQN